MSSSKNILFLMSGSIAIPKAVTLIELFIKNGFQVKVACTETTFKFVSKDSLEKLTGSSVIHKNFQNELDMKHIDLGRWADLTLLCPATANTINQFASGIGDNIVGTLFLAYELGKKPFLIAPAMNTQMYQNPATQKSIAQLKVWGLQVLPTNIGLLACGEYGEGRLLEPDFLYKYIVNNFFNKKEKKKVLITAGATKESIDGVRFITNFSSGRTGSKIADHLTLMGFDVTLVKSENGASPKYTQNIKLFSDFNSLNKILEQELSDNFYDSVIMTAAISDYSVDHLLINNIETDLRTDLKLSSNDEVSIKLKKNFKIVSELKKYSKNKQIQLIAFKLTKTTQQDVVDKAVNKILNDNSINYVIQNDLIQIENNNHVFNLYDQNGLSMSSLNFADLNQEMVNILNSQTNIETNNEVTI